MQRWESKDKAPTLMFYHHSGLLFKIIIIAIIANSTSESKDDSVASPSHPDADNVANKT